MALSSSNGVVKDAVWVDEHAKTSECKITGVKGRYNEEETGSMPGRRGRNVVEFLVDIEVRVIR